MNYPRIIALILSFLVGRLVTFQVAHAEPVSIAVDLSGDPIRSWILGRSDRSSRLVSAKLERKNEKLFVEAIVNDAQQVAAIVQLSDGSIVSSEIGALRTDEMLKPALNPSGRSSLDTIEALVSEIAQLQASKRREAGLDKVDRIYERVAKVEEESEALRQQLRQVGAWR